MDPLFGLSLGRIAVGAVSLAKPDTAAGLLGLDARANPQAGYVARLFGSREIALGALTLIARGRARRHLVLAGIAVDVADAAAGALGIRDRSISTRAGATMIGPALGAVVTGVRGLRVS
ncbi:hypothetical protein G5V58_10560 [Nocardioides anomalus]|uniref:DUF4267 domain-containing protein n=1 Tax=Nocardioides anomalus TaxID=2712223 RepID=A0A6G6WDB6_9ACTN|nr:hypothetical protein [Nocardioides anomalus]QIG43143.1 hypothetical protein G5V58_10560 [Nocardioides anomalus]